VKIGGAGEGNPSAFKKCLRANRDDFAAFHLQNLLVFKPSGRVLFRRHMPKIKSAKRRFNIICIQSACAANNNSMFTITNNATADTQFSALATLR